MKFATALSSFVFMVLSSTAIAESSTNFKPSFKATHTEVITATVTAINYETREVSIVGESGVEGYFVASEEARNLDQVEVGDIIVAEYVETTSIKVVENMGMEPGAAAAATIARGEVGDKPALIAAETEVMTFTVVDINIEANTFQLKGVDGAVEEFQAMNPENLKRAEVGDLVVISVSHAIAVSVEQKPAE
jgi:hypothetical protein